MALNAGDVSQETLEDSSEKSRDGLILRTVEGIRAHAKTAILALGIGAAAVPATADEMKLAEANVTPVTMTDARGQGEVVQEITNIEDALLLIDEQFHADITAMTPEYQAHLLSVLNELQGNEGLNERGFGVVIRYVIPFFRSPSEETYVAMMEIFNHPRLDVSLSPRLESDLTVFFVAEQERMGIEMDGTRLAIADIETMITTIETENIVQRAKIGELEVRLSAIQAEGDERIAAIQAEGDERIAAIQAETAIIRAEIEEIRQAIEQGERVIENLRARISVQPA